MTTDADRLRTMYALLNEACTTSGEPSGAWRALAFSAVQEYRLSRPAKCRAPEWCGTLTASHSEDTEHGEGWITTGDRPASQRCWCSQSCRDAAQSRSVTPRPTALDVAFGALPTPALAEACRCGHAMRDHIYYDGACRPLHVACPCRRFEQVGALPTKEVE